MCRTLHEYDVAHIVVIPYNEHKAIIALWQKKMIIFVVRDMHPSWIL